MNFALFSGRLLDIGYSEQAGQGLRLHFNADLLLTD
jgi:hypothetical protein